MFLIIHPGVYTRNEVPDLLVDLDKVIPISGLRKKALCPTSLKVLDIGPFKTHRTVFYIFNDYELSSSSCDVLEQIRLRYKRDTIPPKDFVFRAIVDKKEIDLAKAILNSDI